MKILEFIVSHNVKVSINIVSDLGRADFIGRQFKSVKYVEDL